MIPIAFIIALLFAHGQRLREAGFLLLTVWGAAILDAVLKVLFHRARPELWLSPAPEFDYGFPSCHCMLTMALALTLVVLFWRTRWRWPLVIAGGLFVLAVGFSRLYLGVHFPSDIIAAWSVAIAWILGLTIYSGQRKFTTFIWRPDIYATGLDSWTYINKGEE
jgi:undecaprenyl-diphosphatase